MPTLYDTVIKIGVDTSELNSGMAQAESAVDNFGNVAKGVFAGNLLYNGARRLGSAILGFAKDSIGTGMNFDAAMSRVQATMLKTSEEMTKEVGKVDTAYGHFEGNLREFAQFLGENTAFSATQAAEALNYMALAGYDTQQSMEMLPTVLSLASAGGMDLARASDMVTDAQTAFGISSERTTQMVDEMAKAASTGNTSVEQLGDAFLVVGGIAKELNGGFVDVVDAETGLKTGSLQAVDGVQELEIALVGMANAGIKGSEAGTHMRNMLMKLSGPTKEGTKALESMGVSVFDAEGKMRSLKDIFNDLNVALSQVSQQEKLDIIQNLFNARDLASAEALLGAVQQDWDKIGTSILNAKDAGSQMAGIQLDNLTGAMTLFRSALEGAQIALADKLTPTLGKFVGKGTKLLQDMTTIFREKGLQSVIDYGVGFVNGLAGSIRRSLPELIPVAMQMLTTFSGSLRTNVGRIVDAGLALVMSLAQALVDNLPVFIETVPTIVSNIAGIINDNAPKLISAGLQLIMMLGQGIVDAFPTIVAEFPKIIKAIFDVWMSVNWLQLGSKAVTFITNGIKKLSKMIPLLLKSIGKNALTFFRNLDWAGMGRLLIQLIVSGINALIKSIPDLLLLIGSTAWDYVHNIDWSGLGKKIINFIVNGLQALFANIPNKLKSIGNDAWNKFRDIDWKGVGSKVINFIVSGLASIGSNIATKLKSIGEDAWNKFRDINWTSLGSKVINFIVSGLASIGSDIATKLKSIGEDAWDKFTSISWSGLGSAIIDGITSGVGNGDGLFSKLRNIASGALSAAKGALAINSPSKVFRDQVGKAIPEGIAVGVDDNAYMVQNAIDSLVDPSDIKLADYDYDISSTGNIGNQKQYSDDEAWLVESPELIERVDYLIKMLEYYMPKQIPMSDKEINRVLGAML